MHNHDDLPPFKSPLKDESDVTVIYRGSGPWFGFDLYIISSAWSSAYSNLGDSFQPPPGYTFNHSNTQSLLAGSHYFIPAEIEVLYLN
jgi:hypothetical protein